jgi:hypothetical protein
MRKIQIAFIGGAIIVGLFACGLGYAWNRDRIQKNNEAISLERIRKEMAETESRIRENIKNYDLNEKKELKEAFKILGKDNGMYDIEYKNNKQRLVEAIDSFKHGYVTAINEPLNSSNIKEFNRDAYLGAHHDKGPYEGLRILLLTKLWSMKGDDWDKRYAIVHQDADSILATDDYTFERAFDDVLRYIYIQQQIGHTAHQALEELVNKPKEMDTFRWSVDKIQSELSNNKQLNDYTKSLMQEYIKTYSSKSENSNSELKGEFIRVIKVIEFDEKEAIKIWDSKPRLLREHWWMQKSGHIVLNSLTSGPAIDLKRSFLNARIAEWENSDGIK